MVILSREDCHQIFTRMTTRGKIRVGTYVSYREWINFKYLFQQIMNNNFTWSLYTHISSDISSICNRSCSNVRNILYIRTRLLRDLRVECKTRYYLLQWCNNNFLSCNGRQWNYINVRVCCTWNDTSDISQWIIFVRIRIKLYFGTLDLYLFFIV